MVLADSSETFQSYFSENCKMSEKPEWLLREKLSTKSLINELKDKLEAKPCTRCNKEFRPTSKYSLFCAKCKTKHKAAA